MPPAPKTLRDVVMALPFEVTVFVPLVALRKIPFAVGEVIPLDKVRLPKTESVEPIAKVPEKPVKFKFLAVPLPENVRV